jgi:hypothetical protein
LSPSKGIEFPLVTVPKATKLYHTSWVEHLGTPLYFGKAATNRYDDPEKQYGCLYLANSLSTALMESVFHEHRWWLLSLLAKKVDRKITQSELDRRLVRHIVVLDDLNLADLCAPGFMARHLGLTLTQFVSRDYKRTQRISRMAFESTVSAPTSASSTKFDGLRYPSRNNYPDMCICLFDRALAKIHASKFTDIELNRHAEWPVFFKDYGIEILPS